MKKILEVSCNGLGNGGVQHVIMNIVSELKNEYLFDIIVFNDGPEYFDDEFLSYGGKIFRIINRKKIFNMDIDAYIRGYRIYHNTYKILKEHGPYEAIHCHNYFESYFCLLAAQKAKVNVRIVHSHNDAKYIRFSKIQKIYQNILRKKIRKSATEFIGCSKNACEYLYGNTYKSYTVNNGIDIEKFRKYDNVDYVPYKKIKLLHVGNFSEQKNQLFLIDIVEELKKRKLDLELVLIGGGNLDYKTKVIESISNKGLDKCIKILSSDSDIPKEMNNADLFLFPSNYEGLGIVLIEAQASGLHCIASAAVPPEANLGNVEYVTSMQVDKWSNIIEKVYMNGQKRVYVNMDTYNKKNIAKIYSNIYSKNTN